MFNNTKKEYKIKIENEIVGLELVGGEMREKTNVEAGDRDVPKAFNEQKKSEVGKAMAITMGKQGINYVLSNYGNLTGDYITQDRLQASLQALSTIAMISSGGVGAIVGGFGLGLNIMSNEIDIYKRNLQVEMLRQRTGILMYGGGR